MRFVFAVQHASFQVPKTLSLNWYVPQRGGEVAFPPLRTEQRRQLTVRLKRQHGDLNPHGFDYEAWMFERGIRATGYVRTSVRTGDSTILLAQAESGFLPSIQ